MAALTTAIAAGSLALGAAGAASQRNASKKALKQQEKEYEQGLTEAKEAAKLKPLRISDPRIKLGAGDGKTREKLPTTERGTKSDNPRTPKNPTLGGLALPGLFGLTTSKLGLFK